MKKEITYTENKSNPLNIQEHLLLCDKSFKPRLSKKVNIKDYSQKLFEKSHRFEAWDKEVLIGLIAVYINDPDKKAVFITNVSIMDGYKGKGAASTLMKNVISKTRELGFVDIQLEVSNNNEEAIGLYKKFNFTVFHETPKSSFMVLKLN